MTIAYFDCFSGAGGDMIVAALIDAGIDRQAFLDEMARLKLPPFDLKVEPVERQGLAGLRFEVIIPEGEQPHRHLSDILKIIDSAGLTPRSAEVAGRIFTRLAEAEAHVHHTDIEKVHFHEVGAVDSIVDIIGAAVAVDMLGIERAVCSPIPLGGGTVECDHGRIPVPAPATARLLIGAGTCAGPISRELTTPTAAAILTELAESYGPPPAMELTGVGYGAGSENFSPTPNLLRVCLGRESRDGRVDTVVELSANIDDCSGEVLGSAVEKLLAAGCVDAWLTPAYTKKSRPAWVLSALAAPADVAAAERIFLTETTTLGVRRRELARTKLPRTVETVETPYGSIRVKVGRLDGSVVTASPEFADCLAAADSHHLPVKDVIQAANLAYNRQEPRK
jgi:hypothetical protein